MHHRTAVLLTCSALWASVSVATAQVAASPVSGNAALVLPAVTLSASVEKTLGKNRESGSVVLKLSADGSFKETWQLAKHPQSIEAGPPEIGRTCVATDAVGDILSSLPAACHRSVLWFAPWTLSSLLTAGKVVAVPQAGKVASATRASYQFSIPAEFSDSQKLRERAQESAQRSMAKMEYDSATSLPQKLSFSEQTPAGGLVEESYLYSDWSAEGSVLLPHHIQQAVQGTVVYDIHITSVTLN